MFHSFDMAISVYLNGMPKAFLSLPLFMFVDMPTQLHPPSLGILEENGN